MPRIRRWFPVTHDINADLEMWELRETFGDRAGFVWLEILSIADRNEGLVGLDSDQLRKQLASKCRSSRTRVGFILDWCLTKAWLVLDSSRTQGRTPVGLQSDPGSDSSRTRVGPMSAKGLWVRNFAEYHRTRETNKLPKISLPSEPSEPSYLKKANPATPAPVDNSNSKPQKVKLDPAIKAAADPIYESDPAKFIRLITWIKGKEKRDYPVETITTTLKAFWEREQKVRVEDWWPYIERIFAKEYGRWNEIQATQHKVNEKQFVRDLIKGI
jgi:hypothetical protein